MLKQWLDILGNMNECKVEHKKRRNQITQVRSIRHVKLNLD